MFVHSGALLMLTASALIGCGRWSFSTISNEGLDGGGIDARDDAAENAHDEDGDGVADASDNCPHLPNAGQDNSDGDQVGDLCDPFATFNRLRFYSLQGNQLQDMPRSGPWQIRDDEWLLDTSEFASVNLPGEISTTSIWVGFTVEGLVGDDTRQIAVIGYSSTRSNFYYTQLYTTGSNSARALVTYADGVGNYISDTQINIGAFPIGLVHFNGTFDMTQNFARVGYLLATGGGSVVATGTLSPPLMLSDIPQVQVAGIRARLHYIAVID